MGLPVQAYVLENPGQPLTRKELTLPEPSPGEVIVEVLACGLCHTDLGFADGSVAPKHPLPLVLGHEVVGTVSQAGERFGGLLGKRVLVPAVMACGECAFCRAGRGNACLAQKMPGNDIHGGFATHLLAPGAALVPLDAAPSELRLDALSVVADAVSTAYQAVRRSGLQAGDVAFVIGGGGVGGFTAQIAHALGAHTVVCDVSDERLEALRPQGLEQAVNVKGKDPKEIRKGLHAQAKQWSVPSFRWRIFECSGTTAGQTLAYTLLSTASTMVVVGFTREPVTVRLSNLMAFDATVHGTWGCPPDGYAPVLQLIYDRKISLEPFIERVPMSALNEHLRALAEHRLSKRLVMDPRA